MAGIKLLITMPKLYIPLNVVHVQKRIYGIKYGSHIFKFEQMDLARKRG
jgi:hypothetical protein